MDKFDNTNITVAQLAALLDETHPANDYLALDFGGVTVYVAKGAAAATMNKTLDYIDSRYEARRPGKKVQRGA